MEAKFFSSPSFPLSPWACSTLLLREHRHVNFHEAVMRLWAGPVFPFPLTEHSSNHTLPKPSVFCMTQIFFLRTRIQWMLSSLIPLGLEGLFFPTNLKNMLICFNFFSFSNILLLLKQHQVPQHQRMGYHLLFSPFLNS